MHDFREFLEDCDLCDLGFSGQWFTWEKGRLPNNNIRERLDRGVTNSIWWERFSDYTLQHLNNSISDHCPLLLQSTS